MPLSERPCREICLWSFTGSAPSIRSGGSRSVAGSTSKNTRWLTMRLYHSSTISRRRSARGRLSVLHLSRERPVIHRPRARRGVLKNRLPEARGFRELDVAPDAGFEQFRLG